MRIRSIATARRAPQAGVITKGPFTTKTQIVSGMPRHASGVHHYLDKDRLHDHLLPFYTRLTSPELLKRCILHKTQNPNESFHNSVWARCHKTKNHSLRQAQFAPLTAAAEFNAGPRTLKDLDSIYKVSTGAMCEKIREDREKTERKRDLCFKGKETARRLKATTARRRVLKESGEVGYSPGAF